MRSLRAALTPLGQTSCMIAYCGQSSRCLRGPRVAGRWLAGCWRASRLVRAPRSSLIRCIGGALGCVRSCVAAMSYSRSHSRREHSQDVWKFFRGGRGAAVVCLMIRLLGARSGATREVPASLVAGFRGSLERSHVTTDTRRRYQSPGAETAELHWPSMERRGSARNPYVYSQGVQPRYGAHARCIRVRIPWHRSDLR